MTIELCFKFWANTGMVTSVAGHTVCKNCKRLAVVTYSKPLKCNMCGSSLSDYSAYVSRTVNSRIIYHSARRSDYP